MKPAMQAHTAAYPKAVRVESSPLAPPVLSYAVGKAEWTLVAEYAYHDPRTDRWITVPAGFCFDLSSVPRPLWWLMAPFDLSIAAPLLHDLLYRYVGDPPAGAVDPHHVFTRLEVDQLFRAVMRTEGVSAWRRGAAYAAVRAFGWRAWGTAAREAAP
jgi:hypothetical protein